MRVDLFVQAAEKLCSVLQGQMRETLSRQISLGEVSGVSLSTRQDDFIVLHIANSFDSLLQVIRIHLQ